jgi:hypothetical protein
MDVVVLKHVVILHNSMTLYFALDLVLCSLESRHTLSIVILDALSIGAPLPPEALLPYYYRATTCINAFKHTMGVTPVVISPLPPPPYVIHFLLSQCIEQWGDATSRSTATVERHVIWHHQRCASGEHRCPIRLLGLGILQWLSVLHMPCD